LDESTLASFDPSLVTTVINCPILAAQEGYSWATNLTSKIESLLIDVQPLLIPEGQKLGVTVSLAETTHFRAFFLPEVCNLPSGLHCIAHWISLLPILHSVLRLL
jgi:hypothetical protein